MLELLVKIKYWFFILWLSSKKIFRQNLGDQVKYKGKKYLILNGVRSNSWRLAGLENGDEGWVKRKECKKIITPKNLLHSFKFGYRFYMTNWFRIWVKNGIEKWMRGCDIW